MLIIIVLINLVIVIHNALLVQDLHVYLVFKLIFFYQIIVVGVSLSVNTALIMLYVLNVMKDLFLIIIIAKNAIESVLHVMEIMIIIAYHVCPDFNFLVDNVMGVSLQVVENA